jgi:chromosome partitioning protein
MQPRKIALGNQKGGVGKTASTLGLASAITAVGGKVLVVDMDQQGNTTGGLGVTLEEGMMTAYHLMNQTREGIAAEAIIATPWDGVDLIPADEELGKIESDGSNDLVFRLDVAFEGLDLSPYDAVLFDCPPNMGKVLFATGNLRLTRRQDIDPGTRGPPGRALESHSDSPVQGWESIDAATCLQ